MLERPLVILLKGCISKVTSSPANAELNIDISLRSKAMTRRYTASVMASRGVREVRETRVFGCDIVGRLRAEAVRQVLFLWVIILIAFLCVFSGYCVIFDGQDTYTHGYFFAGTEQGGSCKTETYEKHATLCRAQSALNAGNRRPNHTRSNNLMLYLLRFIGG